MSKFTKQWDQRSERELQSPASPRELDDSPDEIRQWVRDLVRSLVIDRIETATRSNHPFARAIDLGCGDGRWIEAYIEFAECAVGIDPDPEAIAEARRRTAALRRIADISYEIADVTDVDDLRPGDFVGFETCLGDLDGESLERLVDRVAAAQTTGDFVHLRERAVLEADASGSSRSRSYYRRRFEEAGYDVVYEQSDATLLLSSGMARLLPIDSGWTGDQLEPWLQRASARYGSIAPGSVNWLFRRG